MSECWLICLTIKWFLVKEFFLQVTRTRKGFFLCCTMSVGEEWGFNFGKDPLKSVLESTLRLNVFGVLSGEPK